MEKKECIERILDALGVCRRYLGYALAVDAIRLVMEAEQSFHCIHGSLIGQVAAHHCCSRQQVDRNLRTVIHHAWTVNAKGLQDMAAYPLTQEPTVSEFVEIVTTFILREGVPGAQPRLPEARPFCTR